MNYSDKLPRKSSGHKCDALTLDGFKCKKQAVIETHYHGDSEIQYRATWVCVHLCSDHAEPDDLRKAGGEAQP